MLHFHTLRKASESTTSLEALIILCPDLGLTITFEQEQLTGSAKEMGATIKLDLTSDVTHLIVGGINTPKYKYVAGNRPDVQCLLPEWIEAVLASWKEGGDTDVKRLEEKYKLPTFYGLKICVTGVEDRRSIKFNNPQTHIANYWTS